MAFQTEPAFVHHGEFDNASRKHPASKFLEEYRDDFDSRTFDPKWYAPDYVYIAPDGQKHEGREKAIEALKALYGPLTAHCHEAFYMNATETDYGYEMVGLATLWANLPGNPAQGETKKQDKAGKSWDLAGPGAFHFKFEKDGAGLRLRSTGIMADSGPLVVGMLKRGVLSPKDLGL